MNEMPDQRFWEIIGRTTAFEADPEEQMEELAKALRALTADEIAGFQLAFQRQQERSYSWDLWGAAYVIHGGASDDGFEYFQRWLISKGRDVFEATLAAPDALADILAPEPGGPLEFEEFGYVAGNVWSEKTGIDSGSLSSTFPYTGAAPASEPSGTPFEEDEESLARRYPKLWVRFGEAPLY